MRQDDEQFTFSKENIPSIKRRDSENAAPQRRSIGSVDEDGLIAPAPIKRRSISNIDTQSDRSMLKTAEDNRIRKDVRENIENRAERRNLNDVRSHENAPSRQPIASHKEAQSRPVRQRPSEVQQRPVEQKPVEPHKKPLEQRPSGMQQRAVRTGAEAIPTKKAVPARETVRPSLKCGIMPPMYLKDSRLYMQPYKIEKGADAADPVKRHELKFYLNYTDYIILRQKIKGLLHLDEHASEGGYNIRSLYFDNVYNQAAQEKESGVQFRHKYRIRIYNCAKSVIKFEKKIKTGDFISKTSFPLSYKEFCMLRDGDIEFLLHKKEALAKEVYLEMRHNLLRPCVVVDYYREPFVMNYETIRITFDSDIRTGEPSWDLFDPLLPMMPLLDKGTVVLEVKFAKTLPDYIQNVINSANAMQRSAVSKYIICRQYD
ncbi:MAG: VTC domain-containing protein [Christensenellaceae bacterium]|nr:VTC domain-containing protein [Christensenellaceae bacterium]